MQMSCCLFNIGNTHVLTARLSADGIISDCRVFDTPGFNPENLMGEENAVVSVVPVWEEFFRKKGAFVLNQESCEPLLHLQKMETPETIGADRIANSIALISSGKVPALCVDCGTAITFEFVDSENYLRGGAILPGRQLLRKALHDYTAKLPLIPMADKVHPVPGKNTVEAIRVGVDTGVIGSVREILEQFKQMEPGLRIVFCGGDSPYFADSFPEAEFYGGDFTLKGLAHIFQLCRKDK